MEIKTAQATPIQLNARLAGFILLYVSSIFFVLSSAASYASNHQAGGWTDKQYSIDGSWSINVEGNQTILRLNDDFKTKRGPDLKIFLSKQSINDVTGKTATNDSILLSALKTNKGSQEYVLPDNVDINDYQSLLIHCEQFSVLWGGAAI